MKSLPRFLFLLVLALCTLPLLAEEATFDRTLKVADGPVDLEVVTGSGSIALRSGAPGTITIHGTVRENCCSLFGGAEAGAVKAIASNPPIEQTGNTVRIGHLGESQRYNNISISYELVVPQNTKLLSKTGSGHQEVSGIAGPAEVSSGSGSLRVADIAGQVRAHTGSGSITLSKLQGSVRAHTGSGSIRGDAVGTGTSAGPVAPGRPAPGNSYTERPAASASAPDIDFQTGSGSIRVNEVRGALRAHTGSGSIELEGQPAGDWTMSTGSGRITVRLPAQAAFHLNARTSSGSIHTDRQVLVQGTLGKHELRGTVNGGGFHLDMRTGSGSIRIE